MAESRLTNARCKNPRSPPKVRRTEAAILKLHTRLGELQEEITAKNITIGPVQELAVTQITIQLKKVDKLAPHEQIPLLETAVRRLQSPLAQNIPAIVASKRKRMPP